ncbi:putative late blight resistance protein homolog R1A-3 [Nicotiana tabacum]|uniref:Late blight resistance protein homolog R1B-16 isoform X1 n=2 Tax=Nicotiana tabacum TaxID=4097 RepID=A0A1S3X3P2_TOBAC|nr:PREDICTED: putative late blight resistance protein homolog R1B-16 isoform X1 [Nicotiana tabacum]XP_016434545.1 PREDICTED: putative late blight resistance protein homolog R1B-16 isoform X1 [Nicotiana tabacum]XP_016434546.1 PREDICTED: putative late blight resistance protein homolog R1B-16 isoform X1 [Nicotiana tabacum]
MAHNEIEDMLDHLRRIKIGGDLNSVKIDEIETLELELRFLRTFIKYYPFLLPDSLAKIIKKAQLIVEMLNSVFGGIPDECKTNLNVERLVSHLLEFIGGNASSRYNNELNDSYLSEYMDCLVKNLNDVLVSLELDESETFLTDGLLLQTNRCLKQVKIIQKKMRFLRYLYATEMNGYIDHEKLEGLETRIRFMADNVGQFCFSLWILGEDEDNLNNILSKPPYLLCLIMLVELEMKKIFRGEVKGSKFTQSRTFKDKKLPKGFLRHLRALLVYLSNKILENFPINVSARNFDVAIEFLLVFLAGVPNRFINGKRLNGVLEKVVALVGETLFLSQKLRASSTIKDHTSKTNLTLTEIIERSENLKAQVEERYYKSLKFIPYGQFPTVGGVILLGSFLRKLDEMLKSESGLVMLKPHIGILQKELSSLTSIIRDVAKVQHEHEILKDLQGSIINLAYEAEVVIDSILAQYNSLWHLFCSLPTIIEEIKHISVEVTEMWSENLDLKPCYVVEPSKHLPTQHSNTVNDEEIVGFENEAEQIIRYLIQGTNELDIIPIVGMGGQGKTTIARKVYDNKVIVSHFDGLAWCCISQTYSWIELLREIHSQVSKNKVDKDDELAHMLKKSLMSRRYLIVLDDMWDVKAWDDLRLSFPNDENGSRIIVTTRLEEVGKQVKQHTDPYSLPFLTQEESCQLLQKKVFQQEDCPPELQDVSLEVAKTCKGLPLVVVLAAGIIKKKKMEESWWREVKDALFSYVGKSEGYSLSTMQLSYDNLPDYLRPCLLYMGVFPEDARIPVSKLISLWIAEGFVKNIESGRLEEVAEGYLLDLISSNVVMVSRRRYNGKVKYCKVHDVVLHFCFRKSREEKFMLAVKGHHTYFEPLVWTINGPIVTKLSEFAVKGQFQPSNWKESRLIFNFTDEPFKTRKPFHQHLRSLITTTERVIRSWDPYLLVSKLRLLKVLDLSSYEVNILLSSTLLPLIYLKFLAVYTHKFVFHPKPHLPHLETLIVKCAGNCTGLPAVFWKMKKLRHVEISWTDFDLENNKQQIFKESSKLESLRILKNVLHQIRDANGLLDVLSGSCPNLQELAIKFIDYIDSDSEDDADNVNDCTEICLNLESLTQLQILRLFIPSSQVVSKLHLPSCLKKLVLHTARIESMISFIAGLSSLEYLKLRDPRWDESEELQSEEWCLGDITFHKLKFLKLDRLVISRWEASDESFPLLETLVIRWCNELEEIPNSFTDIQTLKQIKVLSCSKDSLKASAVRIKEEVEDIEGCNRVDIIIKDVYGNLRKLW